MKINLLQLCIQFIIPITIGTLTVDTLHQMWVTAEDIGKEKDIETDFIDIENQKVSGVELLGGYEMWKRFLAVHKEIGLDYSTMIDEEVEKILTKEYKEKILQEAISKARLAFEL